MSIRLLSMADVVRESRIPRHKIAYQLQIGTIKEPLHLNGRRVFTSIDLAEIIAFFTKGGTR
jgi:hypothetical protein